MQQRQRALPNPIPHRRETLLSSHRLREWAVPLEINQRQLQQASIRMQFEFLQKHIIVTDESSQCTIKYK